LVLFKAHIIPKWGNTPLDEVEAVGVERWLRGLASTFRPGGHSTPSKTESRPLAQASKAKVKGRMYSLFEHAKRHKLCDINPIETVRQGAKRLNRASVLTVEEIRDIMLEIPNPAIRLAVLVAGVTALRRSEVRGLMWHDIDLDTH